MTPGYQTVFDLTKQPGSIQPPYGFYAIFVSAGLFLIVLAVVSMRFRWRQRLFYCLFAGLWNVFLCVMLPLDFSNVAEVRAAARRGNLSMVEGCLDYFRPGTPYGTKSPIGNEEWKVAGFIFDYGSGEARPGYHVVEPNGGVVHPDSKVRVFYTQSSAYGRAEILRIDTLAKGCPSARLVEPQTLP